MTNDSTRIVFVPTDAAGARALVSAPARDVQAFGVTPGLRAVLDVDGDEEETERAAMVIGSVWGLTHYGRRLVLVAHVPDSALAPNDETDNGGVTLRHLDPGQITAWFSDDEVSDAAEAAEATRDMVIDDAWNDVTVQTLLVEHELSWHDITEPLPDPATDPRN